MSETPAPTLACTQCGGELHPEAGQIFLTCPYCSATVYLDKARVVFHWYIAPTLDETQASAALRRWMSGSQTVKDLDKKARIVSQTFQYFPLWQFKFRSPGGKEEVHLEPAAATSVTELRRMDLPVGDLRRYNSDLDTQSEPPSVPLEAARGWLEQSHPQAELSESALVHIPIYLFKYDYQNRMYAAVVEAATGGVLANLFPAKAEAPYLVAGIVTAAIYLCLATFPLVGYATSNSVGLGSGLGIALAVGCLAAPFLFGFSVWVASKI